MTIYLPSYTHRDDESSLVGQATAATNNGARPSSACRNPMEPSLPTDGVRLAHLVPWLCQRRVMMAALAQSVLIFASVGVGNACSGQSPEAGNPIDYESFSACDESVLDGLSPRAPYDGWQLRQACANGQPGAAAVTAPFNVIDDVGTACTSSACVSRIAELDADLGVLFPASPVQLTCTQYLAGFRAGDVAAVADTTSTLLDIVGPIDSADEASLYVSFVGIACGGVKPSSGGFDILEHQTHGSCPISRQDVVHHVAGDGTVGAVQIGPEELTNACY